ncbi:YjbF family lipoprotein [Yoonia sp. F2084L]|uniref:YjbF family lipoprotein n=1 Tax=Yoonia sp. F2084L TaxID=2926419 RepID=UPI001FF531B3|nr:YjbF family lipoprotein [Yoonia sp. F2084L]MCK0095591.1 YjbF family lipoprotein [Yoonia sp. F2084L]
MKRFSIVAAALALSGCVATIGQVAQTILNPVEDAGMSIPNVNRAAIEEADLAAVLILSPETGIASVAVAVQKRESLLLYSSNENRGVTMNGGLIYATLGFGTNLQAVLTQAGDPLVNDTPAADWPPQVARIYQLAGRGPSFDTIETTCENRVGATSDIDVVGVTRPVVEVVELCQTADGAAFNNVHYLDQDTGRVWRTSQWTGPKQKNVQVDIIDQFDPNS